MFNTVKHKWTTSFFIVLLSFLFVCFILFPIFNSGDDVFLLYTLAGGYGEPPTNLLHYDHVWHPVLGWIIKSLFQAEPNINWYTLFLLSAQFAGCVALLYVFLRRFKLFYALLLYLLFFFFIETRILLSLNFSSSAWILATGGYVLLLEIILSSKSKRNVFIACLFFMVAGLLRLHILFAVTVLFFPCLLWFAGKEYKRWGASLVIIALLLFLFNQQHKAYYNKHIPGWQLQENFRQSLFRHYNNPVDLNKVGNAIFHDSIEKAFYAANFFYDTTMLSPTRVEKIGIELAAERKHTIGENLPGLYWLFMELRVYLLLLLVCLVIAWQTRFLKTLMRRWLPLTVFAAIVYLILGFFYKMTFTIHMGFLLMPLIYLIWIVPIDRERALDQKKYLWNLLLLIPFSWMGVRIVKNDKENREKHQRFECTVRELEHNSDKLFVATDDALPLGFCSIGDTPAHYKVTNLIYKDRVITHTYEKTLKHFKISDLMQSIYNDPKVFLAGKELPELKNYYFKKYDDSVVLSNILPEYKCLIVRKILTGQPGH